MSPLGLLAVAALLGAAGLALGPYAIALKRSPLDVASRAGWVNRLLQLAADAAQAGHPEIASAARSLIDALVGEPKTSSKGK